MKSLPRRQAPAPPTHLSADAAAIWRPVVAHLHAKGLLLNVDAGTVETYALAVVRQRKLAAALDKAGVIDAEGKPNPLLKVAEATAATVKNLGHVLGLNPMARKALPAANDDQKSRKGGPWAGVLED